MTISNPNLLAARAKIEAILKEHDIAGFVSLHGPDSGEVFWNIWPSYSILKGDIPAIRIVSKAADYAGKPGRQAFEVAQTAQMVNHLAVTLGQCGLQFLELSSIVDDALGTSHTLTGRVSGPNKSNPDVH